MLNKIRGPVSDKVIRDTNTFLNKQTLTPTRIKDFIARKNIALAMHHVEDKKIIVEVAGKKQSLDTKLLKETLREFGYVDPVETFPDIESGKKITVIKHDNNIIINGLLHDRNDIITSGIVNIHNVNYNIRDIVYLVINGIYMNNEELVKYLTNTYSKREIRVPSKLTKLEQALYSSLPELSPYRDIVNGIKMEVKLKDTNLYTINLEVDDLLAIIDVLIENYIHVDYSKLVFTRNSRFPISLNKAKPNNILHGVKHPYLSVEWVCNNLQKYHILHSGLKELFKTNSLIMDGKDLTYNRYDEFTLEESLVLLLFNPSQNMIPGDGYAYLDIPIVMLNDGSTYNTSYRFILVHGLVTVNDGINTKFRQKPRQIPNSLTDGINYMLCTNESELVSNIAMIMNYDLVFKKILELYNHVLDTFIDKTQLFKGYVLDFDVNSTSLKINIKDHIFKYRYLEAQEVLVDDMDVDEIGIEDSEAINEYILTKEHPFKEKRTKW